MEHNALGGLVGRSCSFLFMGFVAVGEPFAVKIFQGSRESIGKYFLMFVAFPKKTATFQESKPPT